MPRLILTRIRTNYLGRHIDNNMTWEESDPPTTPIDPVVWCQNFWEKFGPLHANLQSAAALYQYLDVRDANDPTWFYRYDLTLDAVSQGTHEGDALPYFVGITFGLNRSTLLGGNSRFCLRCLPEVAQTSGVISTGFAAGVDAFREGLSDTFTDDNGGDYLLRIVQRVRSPEDPSLPFAYYAYIPRPIAGVTIVGVSHKVQN
jgi:hypothetical protein